MLSEQLCLHRYSKVGSDGVIPSFLFHPMLPCGKLLDADLVGRGLGVRACDKRHTRRRSCSGRKRHRETVGCSVGNSAPPSRSHSRPARRNVTVEIVAVRHPSSTVFKTSVSRVSAQRHIHLRQHAALTYTRMLDVVQRAWNDRGSDESVATMATLSMWCLPFYHSPHPVHITWCRRALYTTDVDTGRLISSIILDSTLSYIHIIKTPALFTARDEI